VRSPGAHARSSRFRRRGASINSSPAEAIKAERDWRLTETQWLGLIAEARIRAGQFDQALTALDRAAATTAATGESYYQAELYRLRGVALIVSGDSAEAASWLQRAIDTARSQQAKSLELRAATSLARLWADEGQRQKAHDLLAPVNGWFAEGFDTADLKEDQGAARRAPLTSASG
jgi:predicted ATPase